GMNRGASCYRSIILNASEIAHGGAYHAFGSFRAINTVAVVHCYMQGFQCALTGPCWLCPVTENFERWPIRHLGISLRLVMVCRCVLVEVIQTSQISVNRF